MSATQAKGRHPLQRTWLFGAGADAQVHQAMQGCGAQVLIQDLEDFTPPQRRPEARSLAADLYRSWRSAGSLACVRINSLESEGLVDLNAVMPAWPDIVAYPKAQTANQMRALDAAIGKCERELGIAPGSTEILPVCETALGVVNIKEIAEASARIHYALLGAEDLAADLYAQRSPEAIELDYARRRFVFECRAYGIEPIDAPYTFSDVEGAIKEARYSQRLGYRCKSLVRVDHAWGLQEALVPSSADIARASKLVEAFEAARAKGQERVLLDGLWVEVPTYLNAKRLLESYFQG